MDELLRQQARALFGLSLTDEMLAAFATYAAELQAWNERINLTSIITPEGIRTRHFLDSLSILTLPALPENPRLIDVGTGAGLPGLALKIVRPTWHVTLMDSTAKKLKFLEALSAQLALTGLRTLHARAEDAGQSSRHRQAYELVVARSVARLPTLLEYLLPLCKLGGLCIAMKGETLAQELNDSARALKTLGGETLLTQAIHLPDVEGAHYLAVFRKVRPTPPPYPRKADIPRQSPL
jgi:16S rRNA (guanine527-N7)-methyltransferase